MIKVLTVLGTRPEVIKMAPVVWQLQKMEGVLSQICTTSQHRFMQDQMVSLFGLQVDYDLDIMRPNQNLSYLTTEILTRLNKVLQKVQPDWLLVQGDTSTSFVGALAGFYNRIKVAHIEAGLRTYDLQAPFPEEGNRQLTSRLTTIHFAPTDLAKYHLLQENIPEDQILVTGNTVIDTLLWMRNNFNSEKLKVVLPANILRIIDKESPYVLITGHRRENFGEGFLSICNAIKKLSVCYPDWQFIYPVHLNPNVRDPVFKILSSYSNVHLIEPVDYEPFIYLMDNCQIILTDSGGVQEEAPSLKKPVLVMREITERPEGVNSGVVKLVGTSEDGLFKEVSRLIDDKNAYQKMAEGANPYGDGHASQRIAKFIAES